MLYPTRKISVLSFIFISVFSISCFAQQNDGEVHIETSARVDELVAQKKQYNKNLKTLKGYKIQLFFGGEKESYEVKDEFKASFPDIPTKIIFSSPQWKVQAGNFKTRLEADASLVNIKKEYPGAIILATEIDLK